MSEEYVVDTYVKPAVLERVDPQQFGAVPNSSTTQVLIQLVCCTPGWNRMIEMGLLRESCCLTFAKPLI